MARSRKSRSKSRSKRCKSVSRNGHKLKARKNPPKQCSKKRCAECKQSSRCKLVKGVCKNKNKSVRLNKKSRKRSRKSRK